VSNNSLSSSAQLYEVSYTTIPTSQNLRISFSKETAEVKYAQLSGEQNFTSKARKLAFYELRFLETYSTNIN
jgi:hypothetical protein